MDIVCEHCKSKFKVPDEKIPAGKTVSLPCPKCKNKITLGAAQKPEAAAAEAKKDAFPLDNVQGDAYDASEKPFDFVEEEGKTALVCESDSAIKQIVISALEKMEYHITDAKDSRDAIRNMRYHVYDVILVDESFDTTNPDQSGVLGYLERLPMSVRHSIFVTLISQRYRTMDNMVAFNKSVNMLLNVKNIGDIEKILTRGVADNDVFYRTYKETQKKLGKV